MAENEKKLTADIIDYIGKYDDAVLVVLSINYDDNYSEALFLYSNEIYLINVDDDVKEYIGSPLEEWEGNDDFIRSIFKKLVPYKEIINRLDDIDIESYKEKISKNNDNKIIDNEE